MYGAVYSGAARANQPDFVISHCVPDLPRFGVRDSGERAAMKKEKLPLVAALGLGLLAGIIAYWGLKKKEADVRQGWNLVPVVVASRDLPEGSAVTLEMM